MTANPKVHAIHDQGPARAVEQLAPEEYPELEIDHLDAKIERAARDKVEADIALDASEEAIQNLGDAKDELERQLKDINSAILDEGKARSAAIEKWRKAHVTILVAHDRKSQLLVRESR